MKEVISLIHSPPIKVDECMIDDIKELDNAGVKILACSYDYENHKKSILIDKSSHNIAWELGYVPLQFSVSGDVEIISLRFNV